MDYNGSMYAYLYNAQGDVVALFDQAGEVTVRYRYGAWGELLRCWGDEAGTVGFWQPFRYRGYLWDWETGDYYCRSRQYRARWSRFVNADGLMKGNLFTYVLNSPVGMVDSRGTEPELAYDRQRVIEYGLLYHDKQDPYYPPRSYGHNCVRFASQCLFEGLGDPHQYYDSWHCYDYYGCEDQTKSWRLTNPFYRFLQNSDLVFDEIHITKDSNLEEILSSHRILPADVIFFEYGSGSDEGFDHVGILSTVTSTSIMYMANTDDYFSRPITEFFDEHPGGEIVVMCIRDQG